MTIARLDPHGLSVIDLDVDGFSWALPDLCFTDVDVMHALMDAVTQDARAPGQQWSGATSC